MLLLFHAVAVGVAVVSCYCCCCCCCCRCCCCCCFLLLSQLLLLLAVLLLIKNWPDRSPTGPILGQLGIGLEVGGRDRPPGGKSEVGDRNKGAFWVASQKQQNHYFCCTKLQISGWGVISTKHNTDCGTTENRSNSSKIRTKSGNRCVTMSTNDARSMGIKSRKSHPAARRFSYKSLDETHNSAHSNMRRPQHRRKMMGWRSMHASNRKSLKIHWFLQHFLKSS